MMREYVYQKSVNPERLATEIEAELPILLHADGVSTPDGHLTTAEDECRVMLKSSLSPENKLILDSLVERHNAGLWTSPRRSPDDALAVKIDPGTADTDPKFFAYTLSVPATVGDHYVDLTDLIAGRRLQGLIYQIKDAKYGDTIDVEFCSDGTTPNPAPPPASLPENTVLQTFGPKNAPLTEDETGWSRDEVVFNTSKEIPATIKVRFKYSNSTTIAHTVTIDVLAHVLP
jgi:hypothetical protein